MPLSGGFYESESDPYEDADEEMVEALVLDEVIGLHLNAMPTPAYDGDPRPWFLQSPVSIRILTHWKRYSLERPPFRPSSVPSRAHDVLSLGEAMPLGRVSVRSLHHLGCHLFSVGVSGVLSDHLIGGK